MFQLPVELKALAIALLTQGIKGLVELLGGSISGKGSAAIAVVVGVLVFGAEGLIGILPPEVQEQVVAVLTALASILSAFGVHKFYVGLKPAK